MGSSDVKSQTITWMFLMIFFMRMDLKVFVMERLFKWHSESLYNSTLKGIGAVVCSSTVS